VCRLRISSRYGSSCAICLRMYLRICVVGKRSGSCGVACGSRIWFRIHSSGISLFWCSKTAALSIDHFHHVKTACHCYMFPRCCGCKLVKRGVISSKLAALKSTAVIHGFV